MTRLIGGLLVVSLLYGPAVFSAKYITYSYIEGSERLSIPNIKSKTVEDNDDTFAVDYIYDGLDMGGHGIEELIKEKNMILSKIESELDLRSHLKLAMDEKQILGLAEFMECYNKESVIIQNCVDKIDENGQIDWDKMELLHNNEYECLDLIDLESATVYKKQALDSIMRIIESGNALLRLL